MNRNHLEEKLKRAFSAAAPDPQEQILRRCGPREGPVIPMAPAPRPRRRLAGAAAAVLLLCAVLAGGAWQVQHTVASTVSLDVNPSIGIQVNRRQRVRQVTPLNDDGAAVVGNMDFSGSTLEVTVNALIGSMLRGGYLSDLANSILVSVDDADQDRAARLRQQLSDEIAALLQTDGFSGAVLSQTITADRELQELAQSNSITPGKAQLIRQITAQNSFYSFEELAGLSINQLNLLNSSLDNVSYQGQASDKAYIGSDAALQAALGHAGVLPEAAACCEAELDFDDGVMLYEGSVPRRRRPLPVRDRRPHRPGAQMRKRSGPAGNARRRLRLRASDGGGRPSGRAGPCRACPVQRGFWGGMGAGHPSRGAGL